MEDSQCDDMVSVQAVVEDIKRVAAVVGRTPSAQEYVVHGEFKVFRVYREILGPGAGWSWVSVLRLCGLEPGPRRKRRQRGAPVGREALCADLRRVARALGRQPTSTEFDLYGSCSVRRVWQHFESWDDFIVAAGLIPQRRGRRYVTGGEMKADLVRVRNQLGRLPTYEDYRRDGHFGASTPTAMVPCGTWRGVLVKFLNATSDEAAKVSHPQFVPSDEYLGLIRALAARLRRAPTAKEAKEAGVCVRTGQRRFGGWTATIKAAGLQVSAKNARKTAGEYLNDVRRVAAVLGRPPSLREYDRLGRCSSISVRKHVGAGKWSGVLAALAPAAPKQSESLTLDDLNWTALDVMKSASVEAVRSFFRRCAADDPGDEDPEHR